MAVPMVVQMITSATLLVQIVVSHSRLSSLLDEQDKTGKLSKAKREEAQALTELVDMLSLMKLRAERAGLNKR
jgi:hypothetical protein